MKPYIFTGINNKLLFATCFILACAVIKTNMSLHGKELVFNDAMFSYKEIYSADNFFGSAACSSTWTGAVNDDWNMAGNWCDNAVPGAAANVIIPAALINYPVIKTSDATANSIIVAAGAALTLKGNYNLTISNGGSFTNNGSFDAASGTGAVVFAGSGSINGTISFNNVTINGAVDFGIASTINGALIINTGGSAAGVSTHTIIYGSGSSLIYNTGTSITVGNEWTRYLATAVPGPGLPDNVIIQNNSIVSIPANNLNSWSANRSLAGSLTIDAGCIFNLSSAHELYIAGNWANNGSFNANGKKVTFNADHGTQEISGSTVFYDLTFNNSNASTDLGSSTITVKHEFRKSGGGMDEGTSTFIFSGTNCTLEGMGSKYFYDLKINNTSDVLSDATKSAGDIHITNSFTNNGIFIQYNEHATHFHKPGNTVNMYGTGSTTFGNVRIGLSVGPPTTLNTGTHNFTVTGSSVQFNSSNSVLNGNGSAITFALPSPGTITIGNASAVFGTKALFDNVLINTEASVSATSVNFGNGITTINNQLTINNNGSVITNAPNYGSNATLIYNTTIPSLLTQMEWTGNNTEAGFGQPFNVTIQNINSILLDGDRTVPGVLTIDDPGTLAINDKVLTVNSGITGSGSLTGSALSGLILGGITTALQFTQTGFGNYLKDFTVKEDANIGLSNVLNIAGGNSTDGYGIARVNGILNANGMFTLLSDINGTAMIGQSFGTINDEVTVQRYFPARPSWRFIGIPFNTASSQTINQAWQEENIDVHLQCDPYPEHPGTPGFGTAITFNNTNGYDVHNNDYKTSIQYYKDNDWVTPSGTLTSLAGTPGSPFPAYALFVRGDRTVCLAYPAPGTVTTLRPKGLLNQVNGTDVTGNFSAGNPDDYLMIGNPYAAPVNIENILSSSSGIYPDKFWVWDPAIAGNKGYGGYVTFSLTGDIFVPESGSSYAAGTVIQSGQAFMVQRNGTGPASLTFKESCKDELFMQDINVFGAKAGTLKPAAIFINLVDTSLVLMDGIGACLDNKFSAIVDEKDVAKRWNTESEKIALIRDEQALAIELRPVPQKADTLFMRLYLRQQPYKFKIYSRNLPARISKAWVVDKYLGVQTEISLKDTSLYSFTPNSDTNSYRNRFMLVFESSKNKKRDVLDSIITKIKARIFPNPVNGEVFNLILDNAVKGNYMVNIFTVSGKLVASRIIDYEPDKNAYSIKLPAMPAVRNYRIQILNENGILVDSVPLIITGKN